MAPEDTKSKRSQRWLMKRLKPKKRVTRDQKPGALLHPRA